MRITHYNLIYIALIFAILCIFSFLRLHFQTNNYFDYAIYNNLILNSINQNYWMLFFGHFQPLIIFFSLILNLYESNFIANLIIIFLKNLIIILPLLFLYKKKFILVYALSLSFIIWYNSINAFHIDILIFPLSFIYFISIQNKKFNLSIIILLFFCLVKEIYILIAIIYSIMLFKKINLYKLILLNIIFLIFFIFLYFYLIPQFTFFNIDNIHEKNTYRVDIYDWIYNFNDFNFDLNIKFYLKKIILVLSVLFFYYFSFFKTDKKYLLITSLILSIFILSQNTNHSSIYSHYLIPLCAPMYFAFYEYYNNAIIKKKNSNKLIIIYISLFHIIISPSFISLSFYSNINKYFKYENYFNLSNLEEKKFINEFLKDLNINKVISSTNDTYYSNLDKFDFYLPYPSGINEKFYLPEKITVNKLVKILINKYNIKKVTLIPDYIIMKKKNYWIYDKKYIDNYQENHEKYLIKLNQNYRMIKEFKEILIYEKK